MNLGENLKMEPAQNEIPTEKIWFCKIGGHSLDLPSPADPAMREAIRKAYQEITGQEPTFLFSGWGGELTEQERAVVDELDRLAE